MQPEELSLPRSRSDRRQIQPIVGREPLCLGEEQSNLLLPVDLEVPECSCRLRAKDEEAIYRAASVDGGCEADIVKD